MNDLWFNRFFEKSTDTILKKGKVFVLEGPKRVGKTELVNKMLSSFNGKIFSGTGDDMLVREILSSQSLQASISNFESYDLIFIDEAQKISSVGMGVKIVDLSHSKYHCNCYRFCIV